MRTIAFEITIEDIVAFNEYYVRKHLPYFVGVLFSFLIANQILLAFFSTDKTSTLISIVTICIGALLSYSSIFRPQKTMILSITLMVILVLVILFQLPDSAAEKLSVIFGLLPLFLPGFLVPLVRPVYRYIYRGKNDQIGYRTLNFTESRISEKTALSDSSQDWSLVSAIEKDSRNVYIYLGSNKAHIVPLRAFSTPKEADDFFHGINSLKEKHSGSKNNQA